MIIRFHKSVFTDKLRILALIYKVYSLQDGQRGPLPVWLTFDVDRLYGTPGVGELGKQYEFEVVGSNGVNDISASFSLDVYNQGPMCFKEVFPAQQAAIDSYF